MGITGKNDVYEYLVDGYSGLVPGDVSGSVVIAGVCSKGEVGKAYRLGAKSPLADYLGTGPLVTAVSDAFAGASASGEQNGVLIAVPVAGTPGGYIGDLKKTGQGPMPTVTGYPNANADIVVTIVTAGLPGAATVKVSVDDGATYGAADVLPLNGQLTIVDGELSTGITLTFAADKELQADTAYSLTVRLPIGPVLQTGPGPAITVSGTVKAAAQVQLLITREGALNEGQYQLSIDGGDLFGMIRTLPLEGEIKVEDTGVTIAMAQGASFEVGTLYAFDLQSPVPTIGTVMEALDLAMVRLDPELVHVVGPSDAVDWATLSMYAQERFAAHKPTIITCEARLPRDGEAIDTWVDWLLDEEAKGACPFVGCCTAYGEILGRDGNRMVRNAGGLLVGKIMAIPVQRHIGRVKDGPITPLSLPTTWNDAIQIALRDVGFITAQHYESLDGVYWGDDCIMAEVTSDYRYLSILRVVFKALRLLRIQALKSMFDEVGDPVLEAGAAGLAYLQCTLSTALNSMIKAIPQELAAALISIPSGQDIVNNGVDVEIDLIGIPIIKRIGIHTKYIYAGSAFDPRVTSGV